MSEPQAALSAEHHGKMFLAATVGRHPGRAATALSVLIVLTIVLIGSSMYWHVKYKSCMNPKSNFEAAGMVPISNFRMGTNNPLWQRGSLADGGLLAHDPVSDVQTAAYIVQNQPGVRRTMAKRRAYARMARMARGGRDKFYNPDPNSGCKAGDTLITPDMDPSGQRIGQCTSNQADLNAITMDNIPEPDIDSDPDLVDPGSCGGGWDPEAALETQALASASGFAPGTYGVDRLESAAEGGMDSSRGLSDAQLTTLMQFGGAP